MALLFTLHHRNKENEPSSLNGTAPPRRLRDTSKNPYSKSYCKPLQRHPPSNSNLKQAARSSVSRSSTKATTSKASHTSLAAIEEETSPTIRRILEKTGCSSRQELLVMRAAQDNTNKSKSAPNRPDAAPNGARNGSKTTTSEATTSEATTNGCKAATNGAKATSRNGSKSTNGKSTNANSKKKAKSKYGFDTFTPWQQNDATHSVL